MILGGRSKDKCEYHSRWLEGGIGRFQDMPDIDFLEELQDFANYYEKSYSAFEAKLNPITVLKDAAGLYHFSRDNPLSGTLDGGKDPTENENMRRFNKFILMEYDQILKESKKRGQSSVPSVMKL